MSKGTFSANTQERYLGDFVEDAIHEFGPVTISEISKKHIKEGGKCG
jgi:hypothetical protein